MSTNPEAVLEARLAAIVESSHDAIISKSLDNIIETWNLGATTLFGYTAEEAIGQPVTLIVPESHQAEQLGVLEQLRRGERVRGFETVRRRKDGRLVDVMLTISPIIDRNGRIIGASKTAHDISERVKAQAALREAHELLRAEDRRKDEFLATLAHEIRNPLATIRNGLQVMKLAPDNARMIADARLSMERQMQVLVRLVDDLLDVGRIRAGKLDLRAEPLDIMAAVDAALDGCRPLAESMRHEVHVTRPAAPLLVLGDAVRLTQVVGNLLTNAAKYTPAGGTIGVRVAREVECAVIEVRDSGIGIPAEALPRLFDMFVQVDHSLERARGGLGIGLALVRSIVQQHRGSVDVVSDGLGRGSTFTICLPLLSLA